MHLQLRFVIILDWLPLILFIHFSQAVENEFFSGSFGSEDQKMWGNFLRVNRLRRRLKRESAFNLLKLESQLDNELDSAVNAPDGAQALHGRSIRRDDAINDEKCQRACNEKLKSGLDMVKAHSAFGSVGVPSVVDRLDLQMFCQLDSSHDRCLKDCGFEIHFNMRDYVCRDHFSEMVANLACYDRSAAQLKRKCGAQRCGPYTELEVSLIGFAQRCRLLLCDLSCIQGVLTAQCGRQSGERAAKFLVDYTRAQISAWMRDISKSQTKPIAQIIPPSCSRIFCDRFDARNCTSTVDTPTDSTISKNLMTLTPLPPVGSAITSAVAQSFRPTPAFVAPVAIPLARALIPAPVFPSRISKNSPRRQQPQQQTRQLQQWP